MEVFIVNNNRLIDLRDEKDLKAVEIAKVLNVARATYSLWENNKTPIPTKRLIELANFFEVNIDYMLRLTNTKLHIKSNKEVCINVISTNLKEIRTSLGLSLDKLSKKIDYSSSALGRYERAECLIKSEPLIMLSKISNYSIDWILGRSNKKFLD